MTSTYGNHTHTHKTITSHHNKTSTQKSWPKHSWLTTVWREIDTKHHTPLPSNEFTPWTNTSPHSQPATTFSRPWKHHTSSSRQKKNTAPLLLKKLALWYHPPRLRTPSTNPHLTPPSLPPKFQPTNPHPLKRGQVAVLFRAKNKNMMRLIQNAKNARSKQATTTQKNKSR
jgi:hypothetical protein